MCFSYKSSLCLPTLKLTFKIWFNLFIVTKLHFFQAVWNLFMKYWSYLLVCYKTWILKLAFSNSDIICSFLTKFHFFHHYWNLFFWKYWAYLFFCYKSSIFSPTSKVQFWNIDLIFSLLKHFKTYLLKYWPYFFIKVQFVHQHQKLHFWNIDRICSFVTKVFTPLKVTFWNIDHIC